MSSKEVFQKILKRKNYVIACGDTRNNEYSAYLKESLEYDNSKKGFYCALQLAKHDRDVDEESLERYEYIVKHFDKQLLHQFKEEEYSVHKIELDEIENNDFRTRIAKIETKGLLRNRRYYEFLKEKLEFENAVVLFNNELCMALRDGVITDIDHKMHLEAISTIKDRIEKNLTERRKDHDETRVSDNINGRDRNVSHRGRIAGGRGRIAGGRGRFFFCSTHMSTPQI